MGRSLRLALSLIGLAGVVAPAMQAEAQRGIPINIESVPPGATVYLDSTASPPLGTTPLTNVRVPAGSHTFIFQLANHEEARLSVSVRRRRETFRAVLRALATVEVSAGNEGARGGRVSVDGRAVGELGMTPIRVTDLQPGRHQVRVEREGYQPFEQWVEVGGGQLVRIAALLERRAPETGEILVAGPTGAPIFVDGRPVGTTPMVVEGVTVGPHTVEIRPPGVPPYSQQVTILAGQRVTVTMPTTGGGVLRVIATAPGAIISIDGEVIGPSPAVRENMAAGEHIVEATAEGYQPTRQTVTIEAGQQRVVSLDLQRVQGEPGRIVVEANVDGATVIIDNEERGQAPVVLTPEPGPHAIVVRADGHQEYSTTCTTAPGQNCEVDAVLVPQQVRVRVAVQPGIRDAQLFVDGEPAGPIRSTGPCRRARTSSRCAPPATRTTASRCCSRPRRRCGRSTSRCRASRRG
ncbi:MAG: PEGA domain-containing protein [Sandaracinaceae bacterium]|nr:PEGA domain-containing protein [Sandaracinaceae bacterium]